MALPAAAVAAARAAGLPPDEYYALKLLEATGLVVVPGSGFGQRPGEWHFRTTFLPSTEMLEGVMVDIKTFHHAFLATYAGEATCPEEALHPAA